MRRQPIGPPIKLAEGESRRAVRHRQSIRIGRRDRSNARRNRSRILRPTSSLPNL
jgi:hypothetical protein